MSGTLLLDPIMQWFGDDGLPLANGFVYTFAAGSTTFQPVYSDFALLTPYAQGFRLDAEGKAQIYLAALNYKFDVQSQFGVSIDGYPRDNVPSVGFSASGTLTGVAGAIPYFSAPTVLASTLLLGAHSVVIGGGASAAPLTIGPGTTGQLLTSNGAAADPSFQTLAQTMMRLTANSGTDNSAGATNVDTVAITGLTAKDLLLVKMTAISVTQATANIGLYNNTDGVALLTAVASLAAGATFMGTFDAAQSQASATSIDALVKGKDTVPTVYDQIAVVAFTTAWTGNWTLAYRHGGVTAGGILQWRWNVYKLAGQ